MIDRVISILDALVSVDTTSSHSNLPLVQWVESYAQKYGAIVERFPSEDGRKASLWITVGPADKPGLVLSGHTDVVPVDRSTWSSDPFRLEEREGRFYGRGTCDMKGFIAVCLAAIPDMVEQKLRFPVHLSLSYDEEVGIVGVRGMLREIAQRAVKPFACIIGEPTMMRTVIGHKGKRAETVTVRGRGCHSALSPVGVSAITYAARLIAFIDQIGRRLMDGGERDPLQPVPFTTLNVSPIAGGQWVAAVADECRFDYEVRGSSQAEIDRTVDEIHAYAHEVLLPEMQGLAPEADIEFAFHTDYPAFNIEPDAPAVATVSRLLGDATVMKVPFGTEAGLFASIAQIPTIVMGPGSIEQAHKPDEFIEREQLVQCCRFVEQVVAFASSGTAQDRAAESERLPA